MNEYNIEIDLEYCGIFNNLESFLVYFNQTNDINIPLFNIPSLLEYFLSHGADINEKNKNGETALHNAARNNRKEIAELLISHGADINEKKIKMEKPHFILQLGTIVKKLLNFLFHMVLISMKKKIKMEKPHFILQLGTIVKKLLNFLFHMVLISMKKKIKMEKPHFILQLGTIVKKLLNFLFHMVLISMKKK
ncbi:ankyrin repeat protein, putative [Trichomonas vaginalis G3]|uniref:Ankyrin repeat protein, putative n=1 Tax=Trichomonas vaginalis (strain ATCC PRA-98 / G3) TaxID=412133 RepID=A2ETY6_TRIV3|nr:proteasome regulatory particle assembly [Trichomonas vaginalis G3]EAY03874.1 ankyrin repeat protein, putative [Trichomonas vaginalis G3]KAI5552957.1 proteasome regulatory particle assembly [Trichomonas vaginalis G3]|eukprot:XP_001316097.1 ankyrin repeat protein [Trichomonas vaginalis G3]